MCTCLDPKCQCSDNLLMVVDFTSSSLCSAGVAGCMATVLHDAIMNPAEGKTSSLLM